MMLIYVLLLAYFQGTTASVVLHNITKREAKSKCPTCQKSAQCAAKYEVFTAHTACLTKSDIATPTPMTDAERDEIVNHHNKLRASVVPPPANMMHLKWNKELEMLAKRWAEACKKDATQNYYHDHLRFVPGQYSVGQNLAWGGFADFKAATDAWFAEKDDYAQYFGTQLSQFPSGKPIGHYTQLVWATTTHIGCAAAKCDKENFYVCDYAPGGNLMPFSSPYLSGDSAGSNCKTRTSDGLCDCGDLDCQNMVSINASNCVCKCDYAVHAPPHCSLDCSKSPEFFCGTQNGFMETDCEKPYMISACPHLCGICPCAEKTYKSVMCDGSAKSANEYSHSRSHPIFLLVEVLLGYALTLWLR